MRLKVDVIVAPGTFATQAAKQATSAIPIVMGNVTDAVQQGFIASLARPGGNITGFSTLSPDLSGKRLEMLKEAFPKLSRAAFVWNSANLGTAAQVSSAEIAARELEIKLQSLELQAPYDFDSAFRAAVTSRTEAVILTTAGFHTHRERIVNLEIKNRLPVMYTDELFVRAGGLMSYSIDFPDELRRRVARDVALREIARCFLSGAGMTVPGELARVVFDNPVSLRALAGQAEPDSVERVVTLSLRLPRIVVAALGPRMCQLAGEIAALPQPAIRTDKEAAVRGFGSRAEAGPARAAELGIGGAGANVG